MFYSSMETTVVCSSRYLISIGASVSAVNNDGELAYDLAEGEAMEILISDEMEKQGAALTSR